MRTWRLGDVIQGRVLKLFHHNFVRIDLDGDVVVARLEGDINEYDAYEVIATKPQLRLKSLNMFFETHWHELAPGDELAIRARDALVNADLPPRSDYIQVLTRLPMARWQAALENIHKIPSSVEGVGPVLGAINQARTS